MFLVEISSSPTHGNKWLEKWKDKRWTSKHSEFIYLLAKTYARQMSTNPDTIHLETWQWMLILLGDSLLRSLLNMNSPYYRSRNPPDSKKNCEFWWVPRWYDHVTRGFCKDFELGNPQISSGKWRFGLWFPNPKMFQHSGSDEPAS